MTGDRALDPLAPWGPTVGPGHRRVGPGLVDEDQGRGIERRHLLAEGLSLAPDPRGVPLLGVERLLLAGDLQLPQRAEDGPAAAADADAPGQFLQGGVGLLADQSTETDPAGTVEGRWMPPAVGLGGQRAGPAARPQQAGDEGHRDSEGDGL